MSRLCLKLQDMKWKKQECCCRTLMWGNDVQIVFEVAKDEVEVGGRETVKVVETLSFIECQGKFGVLCLLNATWQRYLRSVGTKCAKLRFKQRLDEFHL